MVIKPHVAFPGTSVASGGALYKTNAGAWREVNVQAKDEYGNKKTQGGDTVAVNVIHVNYPHHCQRTDSSSDQCVRCGLRDPGCNLFDLVEGEKKPLNLVVNVTDPGTGIYKILYSATVSGQYKFHIRMMKYDVDELADIGAKTIAGP